MRKLKYLLPALIIGLIISLGTVTAATYLYPEDGGTGTTTIPLGGQILIGWDDGIYGPAYLTVGTNTEMSTTSGGITIWTTAAGGGGADSDWIISGITMTATDTISTVSMASGTFSSNLIVTELSDLSTTTIDGILSIINSDEAAYGLYIEVDDDRGDNYPAVWIEDVSVDEKVSFLNSKLANEGSNYFWRDLDSTDTAGPLVFIENDDAADDQPALKIQQDAGEVALEVLGSTSISSNLTFPSTGDSYIYFNNLADYLLWDDGGDTFFFTNDISTNGLITSGSSTIGVLNVTTLNYGSSTNWDIAYAWGDHSTDITNLEASSSALEVLIDAIDISALEASSSVLEILVDGHTTDIAAAYASTSVNEVSIDGLFAASFLSDIGDVSTTSVGEGWAILWDIGANSWVASTTASADYGSTSINEQAIAINITDIDNLEASSSALEVIVVPLNASSTSWDLAYYGWDSSNINWTSAYTGWNNSSTEWDTAYSWGDHSGAGYASQLDDLSDVAISGPSDGDILIYESTPDSRWEDKPMSNDCTIDNTGAITCDHDALDNYVAAQHVDWNSTSSQFEGDIVDLHASSSVLEVQIEAGYASSSVLEVQIDGISGDITDIFECSSGDCSSVTTSDGDLFDMSKIDMHQINEGLLLPQTPDCATSSAEGQVCWDTDHDRLYIGDGSVIQKILPQHDIDTSAKLRAILGDEEGTGFAIFQGATTTKWDSAYYDIAIGYASSSVLEVLIDAIDVSGLEASSSALEVLVIPLNASSTSWDKAYYGWDASSSNWDIAYSWGDWSGEGFLATVDISDDTNLGTSTDGIVLIGDNLSISEPGIDHDALGNFLAAEHVDWNATSSQFEQDIVAGYASTSVLEVLVAAIDLAPVYASSSVLEVLIGGNTTDITAGFASTSDLEILIAGHTSDIAAAYASSSGLEQQIVALGGDYISYAGANLDLDPEIYTRTIGFNFIQASTTMGINDLRWLTMNAITVVEIGCISDGSIVHTFGVTAPNVLTTSTQLATITCDTDGASTTNFSTAAVGARRYILGRTETVSSGTSTWAYIKYTVDD